MTSDHGPLAVTPFTQHVLKALLTRRSFPDPPVDSIADYNELAVSLDWGSLFNDLSSLPQPAQILDVGSGTGRFLRVLNRVWPELVSLRQHLAYSAVDPVPGVAKSASREAAVFSLPGKTYEARFQDLSWDDPPRFDVIWAMHSLYSLHPTEVESVVSKMVRLLAPGGVAIIALSDLSSFYASARPHLTGDARYALADDVIRAVTTLGIPHEILRVNYAEVIPADNEPALKSYLWLESIGNTWLPEGGSGNNALPDLPDDEWWQSHQNAKNFVFPQNVPLVQFWSP